MTDEIYFWLDISWRTMVGMLSLFYDAVGIIALIILLVVLVILFAYMLCRVARDIRRRE